MISAVSTSGNIWANYAQSAAGKSSNTQSTGSAQMPEGDRPPPPPQGGGAQGVQGAGKPQEAQTDLTTEQLDSISSILEEYDAEDISESDASDIVSALQSEGISESSALSSAMEELGFNAEEIGLKAGVARQRPPMSPMQKMNIQQSSETSIQDLLDKADEENDSENKSGTIESVISQYMNINQMTQMTSMTASMNITA